MFSYIQNWFGGIVLNHEGSSEYFQKLLLFITSKNTWWYYWIVIQTFLLVKMFIKLEVYHSSTISDYTTNNFYSLRRRWRLNRRKWVEIISCVIRNCTWKTFLLYYKNRGCVLHFMTLSIWSSNVVILFLGSCYLEIIFLSKNGENNSFLRCKSFTKYQYDVFVFRQTPTLWS